MNYRPLRVGQVMRDELGKIFLREVEFPGAIVTITEVDVDTKMDDAAVKVSVLPSEKTEEVLAILAARRGELQYLLNRKLNIKPMPRLHFVRDEGPEKAARIEKILLDQ